MHEYAIYRNTYVKCRNKNEYINKSPNIMYLYMVFFI